MAFKADIWIWGWEVWLEFKAHVSVGHVMVLEAGTQNVLLSQFPRDAQGNAAPVAPNRKLDYAQTLAAEHQREPSIVYSVTLPDEATFQAEAAEHVARPTWCWNPKPPDQTHCARSAYDALRGGGLPIDPQGRYVLADGHRREILPNSLWRLLHQLGPLAQVKSQTRSNIPDAEIALMEGGVQKFLALRAAPQ